MDSRTGLAGHASAMQEILDRRAAKQAQSGKAALEIAPDEARAVELFFAMRTQWKWHPVAAARTGLDYGAIGPVALALKIDLTPGLFADVQMMEAEALAEWSRKG